MFVNYCAKLEKIKLSVLETALCPVLGRGTGVSLGSKIVSASRSLRWAGKEDAVLPQTAVMPSCYRGTENRFSPLSGTVPSYWDGLCVCPSVCPSLWSFQPIGHSWLNLVEEKRPPMLLCFASLSEGQTPVAFCLDS